LSGSAKESLAAILAHAKFVQTIPMTGMADDIVPMEAPVHSALRFVRIADNSTIEAFAELNCVSHGVPIETSLSLVNEHTLWHEHAYGFVTYGGDKPVATATAIINEGCLFLFLVATMPDGSTTKFLLDPKHPAPFMFATLDGTIAAWTRTSQLQMELRLLPPTQ
jgi:hypothetical protein